MHYTESEFYLLQQEADRRWWLASSLAIGVHLAVVLTVVFMPSLFTSKPIIEEVVSVSLVSMPDVSGGGAPPPPAAAAKASKAAPEKKVEPPPPPPPPPEKPPPSPLLLELLKDEIEDAAIEL